LGNNEKNIKKEDEIKLMTIVVDFGYKIAKS